MSGANSTRPHGVGVRGANLSRSSLLFQGRFGRIFRALPPADYGVDDAASETNLQALGAKMVSDPDSNDPKDGPDDEESGIPAIYTYLGQFIDHDLTFDPASSLQRQDDPDALVDYRTPRFDLDNIYGRGPDDQPYFYEDGISFILGDEMTGAAANAGARDLPRSAPLGKGSPQRAIIGDPRNDENLIVSQLQGLLHRFHNAVAAKHMGWTFAQVQREVRFHYQWILLNDFLPTLVSKKVLDQILPRKAGGKPNLEFFHFRDYAFMPLEFSAAAYRFGHSMVRPGYRLNEGPKATSLLPIFTQDALGSLSGFRKPAPGLAIDWNLFADLEPRDPDDISRTQLAYRIDTSIVAPLGLLPAAIASDPPPSLAGRNLLRGWRMRLPTGQAVARAMGLQPLHDSKILIGKFTGTSGDILGDIVKVGGAAFAGNCPLWTYCLAETVEEPVELKTTKGVKKFKARKLGPVGGRIVAETFVGLLAGDSSSFLNQDPLWTPSLAQGGVFGINELINLALTFKVP
jgi:hypothetical protein